jgi:hypothetical protein
MKHLVLLAFVALCGSPACSRAIPIQAATSAYPPDYAGLLKTYVTPEGGEVCGLACQQGGCRTPEKDRGFFLQRRFGVSMSK